MSDEPVGAGHRPVPIAHLVVAAVAATVVLFASRQDPVLSADSITYLSAADQLRTGAGFVDFTGEPLTHFPPVFPILLAPGGRSLIWAALVAAAGAAALAALLFDLLVSRVRLLIALAGTFTYVLSQAAVNIESAVWSETPYLVLALASIRALNAENLTVRRSAIAGVFAGLAFLTRYSGAAVVVTGLVMVLASTAPNGVRRMRRCAVSYLLPPALLAALWITRNLVVTGKPLGPHLGGGADNAPGIITRQFAQGLGQLVTDIDSRGPLMQPVGWVVFAALILAAGVTLSVKPRNVLDVGMATFACVSIMVPIASSVIASTDVSARLLSPVLIPLVYFLVIVVDRWAHRRIVLGGAALLAVASLAGGAAAASATPDRVDGSAGSRRVFSPQLYDLIATLPDDVNVLTNNPQRVWWHAGRNPVSFAFTRPKPGNSHFPLSPDDTVRQVCDAETYLAWFTGLQNADGLSPSEVRPDLLKQIALIPVEEMSGGTLFELEVLDPLSCD